MKKVLQGQESDASKSKTNRNLMDEFDRTHKERTREEDAEKPLLADQPQPSWRSEWRAIEMKMDGQTKQMTDRACF